MYQYQFCKSSFLRRKNDPADLEKSKNTKIIYSTPNKLFIRFLNNSFSKIQYWTVKKNENSE